jgi:hypothetical protein
MRCTYGLMVMAALIGAGTASADVCVVADETRDTFSTQDRAAAVLLLERQFELAGRPVDRTSCQDRYTVWHVALGDTIVVTLDGPGGHREGTALGMNDLPALYNQMVRSIVTGKPMTGFNVIDRNNVTAAQTSVERIPTDSFWYARLGYGALFGDTTYGTPAIGFGYRVELDSFGVDVSFFNYQIKTPDTYSYSQSNGAVAGSLLKLEGLYFINPSANRTTYVGAGLSWGGANFGQGWNGNGLQGELTAGYELPRASTLRIFLQADAILPFYNVSASHYPAGTDFRRVTLPTPITEHRYAPSLSVSMGFGWQRDRHRHSAK